MTASPSNSSADLSPGAKPAVIELHLRDVNQFFNMMDPSPFQEKDLDPDAEAFIISWANELPTDAPFLLIVHLDRYTGDQDPDEVIEEAMQKFFTAKSEATHRSLKQLLRRGRLSLVIGLVSLAACLGVSDLVTWISDEPLFQIVSESFIIGGWVAMWRPMEIFLYDWWPVRHERNLYCRLSRCDVRVMLRG